MAITTHSGENGVRELWSAKEVSTSRRSWKDSRPYKAKSVSRSNLVGDERLGPRQQGRRPRLGTIEEQEGVLVGRVALRGRASEDCHSPHQTPETVGLGECSKLDVSTVDSLRRRPSVGKRIHQQTGLGATGNERRRVERGLLSLTPIP